MENESETKNKRFITRVRDDIVTYSHEYKDYFIDYDYLICSKGFQKNPYYIVRAHADNYLHLTGVGTHLKASEFFEKCINGTLSELDINFIKKSNVSEKQIKGSVRRKIKLLPSLKGIFGSDITAEEDFQKNMVHCSFAVGNKVLTLGFKISVAVNTIPMSLMKGNELDKSKSAPIDLVLRRKSGQEKFDEILVSNPISFKRYFSDIKNLLSDTLLLNYECDDTY